jgi:MoaA/NifB/PqqE/SkfB family radical SAM enzyme
MKLIGVFSASHQTLKDEWFLRTLKDDYDVRLYRCDVRGQGSYMQEDWTRAILFKSATIINAIQENWGEIFVYSDVDVAFFAPTEAAILKRLVDKDIVCQLDDPTGNLCTGFFGIRANDATLRLWQQVQRAVEHERRDQFAFNRLVREMKEVRAGYLPASFFGTGTFSARLFQGNERFYIPAGPVLFHANYTVGVDSKIALLAQAQRIIGRGEWGRRVNNVFVRLQSGAQTSHVHALTRQDRIPPIPKSHRQVFDDGAYSRPPRVALELSTACQLKCPSCPTATGVIAKSIGAGFLTLANFRKFLQDHPWVSDIELSNWGEAFLNPDLEQILRHGYRRHVALRIDNGANLDRASDGVLEAVVKYRLRSLSCSIDGASQEVYSVYRVKGNFDRVIFHIRQIVAFKKKYRSPYPALRWQFVAFGHNEHEIGKAREMARELGMEFYLKLSWDDLYTERFSPVKDRKSIAKESGLGVADRQEYEAKFGRSYIASTCHQLWLRPRINFDGRLLGCSINHWDDFGNVFTEGLEASLNGEKMQRTKDMLMGLGEVDEGSPCLRCQVYHSMRNSNVWVRPEDLTGSRVKGRLMRRLTNRILHEADRLRRAFLQDA